MIAVWQVLYTSLAVYIKWLVSIWNVTLLKKWVKNEYTYFTCDFKVSWFRPVSICWRTCHIGDQDAICRRPNNQTRTIYCKIQLRVAFHIETSHLICSAKQMASFCIKCNNELKWVIYIQDTKLSTILSQVFYDVFLLWALLSKGLYSIENIVYGLPNIFFMVTKNFF